MTAATAAAAGVADLTSSAAAAAAAAAATTAMTGEELFNATASATSSGGVDLICLFGRCVDLSLSGFSWADAPLSSLRYPVGVMFVYLAVIWALHRTMRSRPPIRMKAVAAVHNILLTGLSAAMAVGTIVELVINTRRHGFVSVVCDREKTAMTGRLAMWFYVFYLSKCVGALSSSWFVDLIVLGAEGSGTTLQGACADDQMCGAALVCPWRVVSPVGFCC